ncbi:MAG: efflux RND transporter periplasmic adaptor subunit [Endomicrobium sp.]|nr:efflux RND transporter periplasmic adaptor subunit [Endomicrobium sp.]
MEKFKYYLYLIIDKISLYIEREKTMSPQKFKKKLYTIGILLVVIIVGISSYFILVKKVKQENHEQGIIQVKVVRVKKEDFTEKYTVMGSIKGAVENDLRFQIEGPLNKYNFKEGDKITSSQIICSLDTKDAMTKVDYAQSRYKSERSAYLSAKEKYKVYEDMFKMKALAESKLFEAKFELESAELRAKSAQSELELAQLNLQKTNLVAPSDGILAEIIIKSGEYVTSQDVVCKFISDQGTNFEVDIPEKDVLKMSVGQKVTINSDSYPDKEFEGTIVEIAPVVKERTRTATVKINVENKDGLLRSGMFARGVIFIRELHNVVLVPTNSIISLNDTTFLVPVVAPDANPTEGTIQMRPCTVGDKVGEKTIVLSGLNLGELLVVETQGQLSDGVKVKFQELKEDDIPIPLE